MCPIPIVLRCLEFPLSVRQVCLCCCPSCGRLCWLEAVVSGTRLRSVIAVELPDTSAHIAGTCGEDAACGGGRDRDDY